MRIAVICALLGLLLIRADAATSCSYINTISNGMVVYENSNILNKLGGEIKFSCNDGFTLDGVDRTVCTASGWEDPIPTCKALPKCPHLSGLDDGTMSDYCDYQGCKPKFVCDPAWKLIGVDTITCTDQGTWETTPPKCAQNWCNPIETFMNGDVVGYKNPPVVGTQITIKCDNGFELKDANTGSATCQADLTWSGDFGECVCKDPSSTACRIKARFNCPRIISIPFGTHDGVGIKPNSWVKVLDCQPGYSPPVGGGRASKCKSAVFNNYPTCTYHRCPHIEVIPNGKVTNTVQYGWNDKVRFECNSGYKLDGTTGLQCRETRQWGGSIPKCVANTCPDIVEFENGRIINYQNTVNSYIDFECDPSFTLQGSKRLQCGCEPGETPKWRGGDFPKCVHKDCKDPKRGIKGSGFSALDVSPLNAMERIEPEIIGGMDSLPGEFPWQVALKMNNRRLPFCGATLVSCRFAVTACHCVKFFNTSIYVAIAGATNFNSTTELRQTRSISNVYLHPKCNAERGVSVLRYDVAVIEFDRPIVLTKTVRTILLPKKKAVFAGGHCFISGWGSTDRNVFTQPAVLNNGQTTVATHEQCNETLAKENVQKDKSHVCIMDAHSCAGDSGSPLQCRIKGRWQLAGVTSFGFDRPREKCVADLPSVYVNIPHVVRWINDVIKGKAR